MSSSSADPLELLVTGRARRSTPPATVKAGRLELELDGADVRRVAYAGVEIVSQVYVAVRDVPWNTLPGAVREMRVEIEAAAFAATFRSCHAYPDEDVDMEWQGSILGTAEGVITYEMAASALGPSAYSRIGLNVLHGVRTYAGRPYRRSLRGEVSEGNLPASMAPQARVGERLTGIIAPFDHLQLSPIDGVWVELAFEGDEFEMEDQRNFADSTFKTYSTPLQRPSPFHLPAGGTIRQRLTIAVRDERPVHVAPGRDERIRIELGAPTGRRVPPIGLGHGAGEVALTRGERRRVMGLRPDHVRVEVAEDEGPVVMRGRLAAARAEADALGCDVAVDLILGSPALRLPDVLGICCEIVPAPVRLFIATRGPTPPGSGAADDPLVEARAIVASLAPSTRLGVGSASFLADLMRAPFDGEAVGMLTFPVSPTVHRADDRTVMENVDHLRDGVAAVRRHLGARPLHVGPITLATRHGPYPDGPDRPGDPPRTQDPRQPSLFGAAWTTGCIAELASAGVEGMTFYRTVGPEGVTGRDAAVPSDAASSQPAGAVFPLYHVLADAAELRGAEVIDTRLSPDPTFSPGVATLVARDAAGVHVLLASLVRDPMTVTVAGLDWDQARVRTLDERSAIGAIQDPDAFRRAWSTTPIAAGALDVELGPYATIRIDPA